MAAPHASAPTHRVRPKVGNAKWEHVTSEQLDSLKERLGARPFREGYEVEELAAKPAKPDTKAGQPDYLPTTDPK